MSMSVTKLLHQVTCSVTRHPNIIVNPSRPSIQELLSTTNRKNMLEVLSKIPTFERKNFIQCLVASVRTNKYGKSSSLLKDLSKCFNVIWDSGASICVTPRKEDFISFQSCDLQTVKGIGGKSCKISGLGKGRWSIQDVNGKSRIIEIDAFYVPQCNARLLSISQLLRVYPN